MFRAGLILLSLAICSICWISTANAQSDAAFTLPSGVKIKIVEAPFDLKSFSVSGCEENDDRCLINGHIPFGTDLTLPKTYIKSIVAKYKGHSYSLDSSNMYDAWGSRPLSYKGAIRYFGGWCYDSKNCKFRGIFSDAAGAFVAEWQVVNGVSTRTVLTNSSDIMNLFMKHIDPPKFE